MQTENKVQELEPQTKELIRGFLSYLETAEELETSDTKTAMLALHYALDTIETTPRGFARARIIHGLKN